MKWISIFVFFYVAHSFAAIPKSYRLQHPVAWMHFLPVGETPGWEKPNWFSIDTNVGNVWNAPITLRNRANNKLLYYTADFEQTDLILEFGSQLNEYFSHSLEIPYANRGGGFLDHFIDEFHIVFGFDRFNRNEFAEFKSNFDVRVDNEQRISDPSVSEVGNIKYKLKYWPWQLRGNSGQCPCGFALSSQVKIPVGEVGKGHTTGKVDYSFGWHLGVPVFEHSAIWLSSYVTHLGENDVFRDWPRKKWHQTYEMSSEWGLTDSWSFIFQIRMESPLMDKSYLSIVNAESDPEDQLLERVSSGWNSLVHWRGSESIGFRWHNSDGTSSLNFLFIEDWALGNFDEVGDDLYINNAPDVVLSIQYQQAFD